MRFIIVEEIDISPLKDSKQVQKMMKAGDRFSRARSQFGMERQAGKLSKAAEKVLDALSDKDKQKIKGVEDVFQVAVAAGVDSPQLQFLASLPDEAYANKENFKVFAQAISKGEIEIPQPKQQQQAQPIEQETTQEALHEANADYHIALSDKSSLLYNPSFWKLPRTDFENYLKIYKIINNKNTDIGKKFDAGTVKGFFVDDSGKLRDAGSIVNAFNKLRAETKDSRQPTKQKQKKSAEPQSKTSIEKFSEKSGYISPLFMLNSLIKDKHSKLRNTNYYSGKKSREFYLSALNNLAKNFQASKDTSFEQDSMGQRKAKFYKDFFETERYAKPSSLKFVSDFEKFVDNGIQKGVIAFEKPKPQGVS